VSGSKNLKLLPAIAFAAALCAAVPAQAASAHFSRISVEDGLSQSSVESMAEDRFGFLWLGTQEGLNRFDGYGFDVWQPGTKPGELRDGFIRAIARDRRGDLWIGTVSGLQHLDVATGRFGESITPAGIGVRLNTVRVAEDGRVWFGGSGDGLWTCAENQTKAQLVALDGKTVTAVTLGPAATLWMAADGQLLWFDTNTRTGRVLLRNAGTIRVIHHEQNALWLGRIGAPMLRFDLGDGTVTEFPMLPRHVLTVTSAGDGRLWIGGKGAGITRFDPRSGETLAYRHEPGNDDSLAEDDVAVLHQDRGGSLWAGAWNGGLSRLNLYSQVFRTLRSTPGAPDSLPDDDVIRMAEGPDGRLWTVTRNEVLAVGDPVSGAFRTVPLGRDLTSVAFLGPRLFVGTTTGLVELDPQSGRIVGEPLKVPIASLEGSADALWIIGNDALHRLSGAQIQTVPLSAAVDPMCTYAPSGDRIWIANADGTLLRVTHANGALSVSRAGDASIAARRLIAVSEHRGTPWIGTALGIGRLSPDGTRVEWIDLDMPSHSVASLAIGPRGLLWIAHSRGITRFDPKTRGAVNFGEAEGAQGSGYVDGGIARGRSGAIYLAGRGITVFDPTRVVDNPYRPKVVFTGLEILHRPVLPSWMDPASPLPTGIHAADEVTLPPDAAVFSIEMAAPGASDPKGVVFAHRLEGFEDEWIETGAERRLATYTRLAPGRYTLRARARTQSGAWSERETTLRIRILAPWWRTPAALIAWTLLALGLVALIIREARRRTRMRVALAEQDALRRASFTDPLTGLYNRRFLQEWLAREVPRTLRTHREQHPESLLFIVADLDNLKAINDAGGHAAGDRAIRAVAELLEAHARAEDVAARLGGDEFLLIARGVDHAHAGQLVERLRAASRESISLGFAFFPFIEPLSWTQTLQLADRALLLSKRRGRGVWTGFLATPETSAEPVAQWLEGRVEGPPEAMAIAVVEG
jgi:diguanylate cyclase (GGDEF)-like protein